MLVPGLWLTGETWSGVVPHLEAAGHRCTALTLPGLAPGDDPVEVGLADQVAAVVAAVDAADGPVALVGHSAGCGLAWAATDARPDRVAVAVLVGGFPTADGHLLAEGFAPDGDVVPLPPTSVFSADDLAGFDEAGLDAFRAGAVPVPARVLTEPQRLGDDRRFDVRVVAVCPEYTAADLRSWVTAEAEPVRELGRLRHLEYADLGTGHWPQLTDPDRLGRLLVDLLAGPAA